MHPTSQLLPTGSALPGRSTPPDFRLAPLRIVLIEDSSFDAQLVRECLVGAYPRAVIDVVTDEDGLLEHLVCDDVDLILSDYLMTGFNGSDALRLAITASSNAPFIVVSGVIGEENAVEMMKQGATDYVSKSRLARLPVVIERALREVAERRARGVAEHRLREADLARSPGAGSAAPAVNEAVFVLTTDGGVVSSNAAARRSTDPAVRAAGSGDDGASGSPFAACLAPGGELHRHLGDALDHDQASFTVGLVRVDETRFEAQGRLTALFDGEGRHSGFLYEVAATPGAAA